MYFLGIDIGGTNIKGCIADEQGNLLATDNIKTDAKCGIDTVINNTVILTNNLLQNANKEIYDINAMGIGVPGIIDSKTSTIIYNNNLGWKDVKLVELLSKEIPIPIYIANDGNVAALGESIFGGAKEYRNSITITLGTGVGGGIIIDNEIFEGTNGAGAEVGHMVICIDGAQCTCGRRGCFEAYSSATALKRQTLEGMEQNRESGLWKFCKWNIENINAKTAFKCYEYDITARAIIDKYIKYLAEALVNLANIFRPEIILLGGGISREGDGLILPVRERFNSLLYANDMGVGVRLELAQLKNNAGFLGAVALAMQNI